MRVMTWNLLTETATQAEAWEHRAPVLAERVAALSPTVLGTQEGSVAMLDDLVSRLPDRYRWVGEGRLGRGQDETCSIVYDADALTLLDIRHRWLSATPEVPGSKAPDADLPRMLTVARFHDASSDASFTVVNVHLDHIGGQARVDGAAQVVAAAQPGPTIVTGDFNALAGSSTAYRRLVDSGLVDALEPRDRPGRRLRTYAGLHRRLPEDGEQIDWILVTPGITVVDAWVEEGSPDGLVPSDHRAVVADVHLT